MKHPRATISLAALVSAVVWAATAAIALRNDTEQLLADGQRLVIITVFLFLMGLAGMLVAATLFVHHQPKERETRVLVMLGLAVGAAALGPLLFADALAEGLGIGMHASLAVTAALLACVAAVLALVAWRMPPVDAP